MNYQAIADSMRPMTCIISIEKLPDGSFGNIRYVAANEPYINAYSTYSALGTNDFYRYSFIPDTPYQRYMPEDRNFEDFVYRCAVLGQTLHTYIHPERFSFWINLNMIPLQSDRENVFYCSYSQELSKEADSTLMSDISVQTSSMVIQTCLKLNNTKDFLATLNDVMSDIRNMCGADHCCILLTDFANKTCTPIAEAHNNEKGFGSLTDYINNFHGFFDIVESWRKAIAGSTCLILKDEQDLKVIRDRNPKWYNSMIETGLSSLVLFPLKSNDEILGYIWAVNFDVNNVVTIKETLELTTFLIASEISNYQLLKKLKVLSSIDVLTGVLNRNSMNNRVDRIISGKDPDSSKKLSIVFADINGLKRVNDKEGHVAGDLLIKNAALVLKNIFSDCEIYRAGGDEFVIFAFEMDDSEFENRIRKLREDASDPEFVSFAVGTCTDNISITEAMTRADAVMYADKEVFYEHYPDYRLH